MINEPCLRHTLKNLNVFTTCKKDGSVVVKLLTEAFRWENHERKK